MLSYGARGLLSSSSHRFLALGMRLENRMLGKLVIVILIVLRARLSERGHPRDRVQRRGAGLLRGLRSRLLSYGGRRGSGASRCVRSLC